MESNKIWRKIKDTFNQSSHPVSNEINHEREKGEDYYNKVFEEKKMFHAHYTSSPYYGVWTVILDKIRRLGKGSILEIGCGTGQLASAIHDADLAKEYLGFDFSETAIKYAKINCPALKFVIANALETDLYETFRYDIVMSTEFLEHVEGDIDVIRSIRSGTNFIGSVPDYPWRSHVRHFPGQRDVSNRYAEYFNSFEVIPVRVYETKTIYLFQGIKK